MNESLKRRAPGPCAVDGCHQLTRSGVALHCETHYYRIRRNGHLDLRARSTGHITEHGYRSVPAYGHPLAWNGRFVYEHRKVYYDVHGAGPFRCRFCNKEVTWDDLHIAHLDDDKLNNNIGNLAASCAVCNQQRGHYKGVHWAREHLSRQITFDGETKSLPLWAEGLDISKFALRKRLDRWSPERALKEPRGSRGPLPEKRRKKYGPPPSRPAPAAMQHA